MIKIKNVILIIFSTNEIVTKEIIHNADGLKQRFCDIVTSDEVLKNQKMLINYKAIIDCTVNNIFYNSNLKMKNGREITEQNYTYLKTVSNKFIIKAPNTSCLTSTYFNKSKQILESYQKDYNTFLSIINFISSKIPELKNIYNFEKAIEPEKGLILNMELNSINSNQKVYKLVKKLPISQNQNNNIEYITYDDIFILNELKNIIDNIK